MTSPLDSLLNRLEELEKKAEQGGEYEACLKALILMPTLIQIIRKQGEALEYAVGGPLAMHRRMWGSEDAGEFGQLMNGLSDAIEQTEEEIQKLTEKLNE